MANYLGQGTSAAAAGVQSSAGYAGAIDAGKDLLRDDTRGWGATLSGARDTYGVAGVAGGVLGAGASLLDAKAAAGEALASSNSTGTRAVSTMAALSSLADATKSSATAAFNLATLINARDAVTAGAQIGAAGGAIAMGAIEIIRGTTGGLIARHREQLLRGIAQNAAGDIKNIALDAAGIQNREKKVMASKVLKGAVAITGGVLLAAAMTNPIGWTVLGGAAIIGGISALLNYLSKRKSKRAVAVRELGITDQQKLWEEKKEKEANPVRRKFGTASDEWLKNNPEPLTVALKNNGFVTVGHFFANYIDYTANYMYTEGVMKKPSVKDAQADPQVDQLCQIVEGMGLSIRTNKAPREPEPKHIDIQPK